MENFVGVGAGSFLAEEITDLHIAAKRHPARPGPCQRVIGWMQDVPNAGSQILACQISTRAADNVGSQILVGGKFVEERNFFFFIQWLTIYPLPNVES